MATATHFKLGLFTLLAIVAIFTALFGLGVHTMKPEVVRYHTYFDESVQGLEVGAPVKFRGVSVGSVEKIEVARDDRHIDVILAVAAAEAPKLGTAKVAPDLRTQLGTQGITGVKLIDIDFFDAKANPPPELSFQPTAIYIPAAASFMKGLEDNVAVVLARLPVLIDSTTATLAHVSEILDEFRDAKLPARFGKAIDNVDSAFSDLRVVMRHVDQAQIPSKAAQALDTLNVSLASVNQVIERMGGDGGLVASTQHATDSMSELGRGVRGSTDELERTLRNLDEAAQAIRELAQSLDRDPDMLINGRAKETRR